MLLHASLVGVFAWSAAAHSETYGAKDAGGASVAIQAVNTIPLPHHGPENRLATDTDSEVPQAPPKPVAKAEKPPPDAVPLKSRTPKKTLAEVASEKSHLKPFKENDPYTFTSKTAPAVSSTMFSSPTGAGRVSTGATNTMGDRFSAYGAQIQQLVASHWRTDTIDGRIRSGPTVTARFDLMRDGSVRGLRIVQGSDIPPLDASVQRAIQDASPLPPLPAEFPHDQATFEFIFELKR